jgi:hypothetical protein
VSDDEVSQYLVHPALRPALDEWLTSRGLRVDRLPTDVAGEDSLPTYLISPGDELMEQSRREVPFIAIGNNEPIPEHLPEELKQILREKRGEDWEPPTGPGTDPARRGPGPIA